VKLGEKKSTATNHPELTTNFRTTSGDSTGQAAGRNNHGIRATGGKTPPTRICKLHATNLKTRVKGHVARCREDTGKFVPDERWRIPPSGPSGTAHESDIAGKT